MLRTNIMNENNSKNRAKTEKEYDPGCKESISWDYIEEESLDPCMFVTRSGCGRFEDSASVNLVVYGF